MKNRKGCIYIIKNSKNNKVYVGQTLNIKERWRQHKTAARNENNHNNSHSILYPAMRKYGIENFYIEILEENIESFNLNEREKYWIKYYNCVRPNGYNILPGINIGEQYKRSIYQLDKNDYHIIKQFNSIIEASKETNTYLTGIYKVLNGSLLTANNYRWCYQENYDNYIKNPPQCCIKLYNNAKNSLPVKKRKTKAILQFDKNNNFIKEWNSVQEACDSLNCSTKTMYNMLNGHKKTCKGYIWQYKE